MPTPAVTALLIAEPEAVYHANRAHYLSSHALADFRRCPLLFRRMELGLIPQPDAAAFRFGRAAHCRILEGADVFATRYGTGGPINPKTGRPFGADTKAFAEWAQAQGRPVVATEDAATIATMAAAVADHGAARELLAEGVPEAVARAPVAGTPSQARLDWFNPLAGIVDLKTVDRLDWFEHESRSFGYVHQMAFYRAVLQAAGGPPLVPVHLIAVEKQEPFRVGVWRLSDQVLDVAASENRAAIERLARCRAEDRWPTLYESVRVLDRIA